MSEPFLVIGAPVHQRAWVLPDWLHHIAIQDLPWEDVVVVVNYGRSSDGTLEMLREAERMLPWTIEVLFDEGDDHLAERRWDLARYEVMARLRNALLERVRALRPDYYLSLDTDILLPENALKPLFVDLRDERIDAVSPLLYMTPVSTHYPNAMVLRSGLRPKIHADVTMAVDVAFAAVLMKPSMYEQVDYASHPRGEDIGWGLNAQALGKRMVLNAGVRCKHVMNPEMLLEADPRIGW